MIKEKRNNRQGKIIGIIVLFVFLSLILPFESTMADQSFSDSLAEAILVDPSYLVSSSYSDTDDYGNKQATILSSLGTMNATHGNNFILLSTGIAGARPMTSDAENPGSERGEWFKGGKYPRNNWPRIYDRATLSMDLTVPDDMYYIYYDIQFYSTEFPDYVGSNYNDKITVTVESPSKGESSYVIDVNNGHFVLDSNSISGTGFDIFAQDGNPDDYSEEVDIVDTTPRSSSADAGATALHTEGGHEVSPNEQITVTFEITDEYDNQFDSSVFIDNLMFAEYARPVIEASKTVEDLNGDNVKCSDKLKYSITVSNTGIIDQLDNPGNEIEDYIPENTEYVASSATATSGVVSYDSNENKIYWNGAIPGDSSVLITFDVQIFGNISSDTLIANKADIYWDKDNDQLNEEYLSTDWVNVTIHNTPPVAVNDSKTIDEDTFCYIDVLSNDYDPFGLSFRICNYTSPSHGTLSLKNDGRFMYHPESNFHGMDSFEYCIIHSLADDEDNLTDEMDTATVKITVLPINDPPVMEDIPGQKISSGQTFDVIDLDEYVSDPDNTDEELSWSIESAKTLWIEISTNEEVETNVTDWIQIDNRTATITYPDDESAWGKPEPSEDYKPGINDSLFVFQPEFSVEDPEGLSNSKGSVGKFILESIFEPPSSVSESFSDDSSGERASELYRGRQWFSTGFDGVGCNFEVSDSFSFNTAKSFKTKIRLDGTPLYWYYNLSCLQSDLTAWEIWFYSGKTNEYSDVILDFKNIAENSIAKIKLDYDDVGEKPFKWIPRIQYWDGTNWLILENYLDDGWYKLRLERNDSKTDYFLFTDGQDNPSHASITLNNPFSDLSQVVWYSSKNAIVCPLFFWDDHTLELEPSS